jgi:8-oxo-dGTP pyrophosphatase MutT (NUDIX family)
MVSSCVDWCDEYNVYIIYTVARKSLNNDKPKLPTPFTLAFLRAAGQTRSTPWYIRKAVRAVVHQGDRLLLVHSEINGDYKFPGGGVQHLEHHRAALARETQEETGYQLNAFNLLLGLTIELDLPRSGQKQPFRMVSFYYLCDVRPVPVTPEPDAYESKLGFHPVWISLAEALRNNERLMRSGAAAQIFWLARETAVLHKLSDWFPFHPAL